MKLKIAIIESMFIIGNVNEDVIHNPRIFMLIDGGKRVQMSALLGNPTSIRLLPNIVTYDVNEDDKATIELYNRVTTPQLKEEASPVSH
jgi:hypothetical protein